MRYAFALTAVTATFAAEMPKDEARARELYDSGKRHEDLLNRKIVRPAIPGY